MKNPITRYVIAICGIFYLSFSGCSESPTEPANMVDSGSWYETGHKWPHDGNPVESANFVVYSDAGSMEARQLLSQICEDAFTKDWASRMFQYSVFLQAGITKSTFTPIKIIIPQLGEARHITADI